MKDNDGLALRGIGDTHHTDLGTQVNGSMVMEVMEVLLHLVSAVSGHGRRSVVESGGGTWSVSVAQNPRK
jgi:hypothetical protein